MTATFLQDGNLLWICVPKVGNPPPWQAGVSYKTGDIVVPRIPTAGQSTLAFQVAGFLPSSGSPEPTWPTVAGGQVSDGAMTWVARDKEEGPARLPESEYFMIDETVNAV